MVAVGLGDDLVFTLGAAVAERIETQSSESPNADRAKQQKPRMLWTMSETISETRLSTGLACGFS